MKVSKSYTIPKLNIGTVVNCILIQFGFGFGLVRFEIYITVNKPCRLATGMGRTLACTQETREKQHLSLSLSLGIFFVIFNLPFVLH